MGGEHNAKYYELEEQQCLGALEFVEEVKKEVAEEQEENLIPKVSLAKGVELLVSLIHIEPGLLRSSDRSWELS